MTCGLRWWSKSKPDVEFQCGGRWANSIACHSTATCHIAGCCHLANSMSWCQRYVSHCRVLPLGEFTVMIPEPYMPRPTLQGVIIPSAILKIVFRHILFFGFINAVWALTGGDFRIVSNTLVYICRIWRLWFTHYQSRGLYGLDLSTALNLDWRLWPRLFTITVCGRENTDTVYAGPCRMLNWKQCASGGGQLAGAVAMTSQRGWCV